MQTFLPYSNFQQSAAVLDFKRLGKGDMIMSAAEHSNYRRYVPYGKYTGRGSGTHRMSQSLTKLQ